RRFSVVAVTKKKINAELMPKSSDLQMQSGARPKSARKRIEEREDEFTHDSCNVVPSQLNFNDDGLFSKDTWLRNKCFLQRLRHPNHRVVVRGRRNAQPPTVVHHGAIDDLNLCLPRPL